MPVTDLEIVNLHNRRVIGRVDLKDRFLDVVLESLRRHAKARTTGPGPTDDPDPGGWFTTITVTDGAGSDHLDFSGANGGLYGADGTGELISIDNGDDRLDEVQFPDSNGVTYYMAARTEEVPQGISTDTSTGDLYYDRTLMQVGQLEEPSAVVDNTGTITFTLANHKLDGSDSFTGRTALVWLKTPQSGDEEVAIEECTITGTSITTTGTLGQSVVSTTASDYEVIIVGPTITRFALDSTSVGWAFIGTVVGGASPRTFDFSEQRELVALEQIARQREILPSGWITLPTASIGGGGANVSFSSGVAFLDGRAYDVAASGAIGSFPAGEDFWISYDVSSETYAVYDDFDDALAQNLIPLFWGHSDGSSLITTLTSSMMGARIREFGEPLLITLASDSSHSGAFRSLQDALAAAKTWSDGAIDGRGAIIEIVGDVTVSAAISDEFLLGQANITIRGRSGGRARSGVTGTVSGHGARLIWSFDGSVLSLSVGTPAMKGWTFRDLTLRYTGTATGDTAAFISNAAGTLQAIAFENVVLDGNTVLGAGNGALPHLVYSNSGTVTDLLLRNCGIYCRDAAIFQAHASGGIVGLRVVDCEFKNAAARLFTTSGIVDDAGTGSVTAQWRIRGCHAEAIRGTVIASQRINGLWINECFLQTSTLDEPVLDLGRDHASADIDYIWIGGNNIQRVSMTNPASDIVLVRGEGLVHLWLYANNIEDGDVAGATARAISFEMNTVPMEGPILFGNSVHDVNRGVMSDADNLRKVVVFGNQIDVAETPYNVDDTEHVVFGNRLISQGGGGPALSIDGTFHSLFGNLLYMGADVDYAVNFAATSLNVALVGNVVSLSGLPLEIDGDSHVILGNMATDNGGGSQVDNLANSTNHVIVGNQFDNIESNGVWNIIGLNQFAASIVVDTGGSNIVLGNFAFDDIALDGSASVCALNYVADDVTFVGDDCMGIGNFVNGSLTVSATGGAQLVGNVIVTAVLGAGADDVIFVANVTNSISDGAHDDVIAVGNRVAGGTYDFQWTNSVIVGNDFFQATAFSLNVASANTTLSGNVINDGTPTDAGTGNDVAGGNTNHS